LQASTHHWRRKPQTIGSTIIALAGDDVVEASGLTATGIALTEDGGDGDDIVGLLPC